MPRLLCCSKDIGGKVRLREVWGRSLAGGLIQSLNRGHKPNVSIMHAEHKKLQWNIGLRVSGTGEGGSALCEQGPMHDSRCARRKAESADFY
jgi:hypothetical protein